MGKIQYVITAAEDATEEIINILSKENGISDIQSENVLAHFFDNIQEGTSVLIEYPYVDKVYRDSYYSYYSSKHKQYLRDCIRVSFFSEEIAPDHIKSAHAAKYLQDAFLGYVIIRPTLPNVIGRSLLHKGAFRDSDFIACQYKGNVTINGIRLEVEGFPYSSQDTESISCAETTLWALMEYFGNRYPDYKPVLPSTILSVLHRYSRQRLLPSNGLTVDQISFALKEFGFGTYIYSRDEAYQDELENIIATYIESGIPLIAALTNSNIAHAILIVGHAIVLNIDFGNQQCRELAFDGEPVSYIDYTDIDKQYVIQDDNLPPYRLIELTNPAEHYSAIDDLFRGCTIESIVVPLHKKIYLEADKAKHLVLNIVNDADFGYRFGEKFIFRFFLASSRTFKTHIAELFELKDVVRDEILMSKMPKFIWCGEFYERNDFGHKLASGLVIVDATEANENKLDALIFAGYPTRCISRHGEDFVYLQEPLGHYIAFENNLK